MNTHALFESVVGRGFGMSQREFADAKQDRKLSAKYVKKGQYVIHHSLVCVCFLLISKMRIICNRNPNSKNNKILS
jgi:hypothetical protein